MAVEMLDELAGWGPAPPVVVADAAYGDNAHLRTALEMRGLAYVLQVKGAVTAHDVRAQPETITYSGLGPHPRPRYRTKPVSLREHVLAVQPARRHCTGRPGRPGQGAFSLRTGHLRPWTLLVRGDRESVPLGMKNYPSEFKRDAVALYESRPGATIAGIAADLGISAETLRNWIRAARAERGEPGRSGRRPRAGDSGGEASLETVEAENAALRRRVRELEEERDIQRKAARYFAGETRW
jgi:transposase